MKVLQVHNFYREPGGEDSVAASEAAQLRAAGHEVIEHHTANPETRWETYRDLALAPWNPIAAREMRALVSRHRPEVVHIHNTWFHLSPSVLRAAHQTGSAVVATMHNYRSVCANYQLSREGSPCERCIEKGSPWSAVRFGCYQGSRALSVVPAATISVAKRQKVWHRDVDAVIALTEFARGRFEAAGFPSDRLVVKPNSALDPGGRTAPPSASKSLLFVGRLTEEKGVRLLLDAWHSDPLPGYELQIVGDGELRDLVETDPSVHYHGRVDSGTVRQLMLTSRALVFPSLWYEGFPLTLVEAAAAGLPALASDLGAMPGVLGQGYPLLAPVDRSGLATALSSLDDDVTVDNAGAQLRARFEANYTEDATAGMLVNIYQQAIARRRHH